MPKAVLHSQLKTINPDLVLGEDYILSKSLTIYLRTREVIWSIYDIEKELKDKGLHA